MGLIRGIVGLVATVGIAAAVAYGVSARRNLDNMMDQRQASLGRKSINQEVAATQAKVRADQCERFTRMAEEAWDRAVDQGTADRDADRLDEMDRLAEQACNP